jgi:hypothetical protein
VGSGVSAGFGCELFGLRVEFDAGVEPSARYFDRSEPVAAGHPGSERDGDDLRNGVE